VPHVRTRCSTQHDSPRDGTRFVLRARKEPNSGSVGRPFNVPAREIGRIERGTVRSTRGHGPPVPRAEIRHPRMTKTSAACLAGWQVNGEWKAQSA